MRDGHALIASAANLVTGILSLPVNEPSAGYMTEFARAA